jgi:hypothetical protein
MSPAELRAFADTILNAMLRVPSKGRFGSRKVFVSSIWQELAGSGLGYSTFQDRLIAASRLGFLSLARADLVAAMPPEMVAASETPYLGATFHFVIDPTARDAWV